MKSMTIEEFKSIMKQQGYERVEDATFRCPHCNYIQSAQDLIGAGAGKNFKEVEGYIGFSCIGRWDDKKGCNWTLGGLFQIHELEIITSDGKKHPHFEPATKEA